MSADDGLSASSSESSRRLRYTSGGELRARRRTASDADAGVPRVRSSRFSSDNSFEDEEDDGEDALLLSQWNDEQHAPLDQVNTRRADHPAADPPPSKQRAFSNDPAACSAPSNPSTAARPPPSSAPTSRQSPSPPPWCCRGRLPAALLLILFVVFPIILLSRNLRPSSPSDTAPSVLSSPHDNRQYRLLTLRNDLTVLLVSDNLTDVGAAALDVKVGSMADPPQYLGLAHFLEHMLFLGTAKYPSENSYNAFLSAHGGSSNAYTDQEDTNYYFDVDWQFIDGALDRFAQFFVAPLLTAGSMTREMNAVNSEHQKNLLQDNWRLFHLLKHVSSPATPFSQFSTGSLDTLNQTGVHTALVSFHRTYYTTSRMRLTVLGRQSLDDLELMVTKSFVDVPKHHSGGVVSNNADSKAASDGDLQDGRQDDQDPTGSASASNPSSPSPPSSPSSSAPVVHLPLEPPTPSAVDVFPAGRTGVIYSVIPVSDVNEVHLYWPLPSQADLHTIRAAPTHYLSGLMGDESHGSLLSYLRDQGIGEGVAVGLELDATGFALLRCSVTLLPDFVASQTPSVAAYAAVDAVFSFVNMLQASPDGVSKQLWDESVKMDRVRFRFPQKYGATDTVSSLARSLHRVGGMDVLAPPSRRVWDADLTSAVLSLMTPANTLVFVLSHHLSADDPAMTWQTEPVYGTQYSALWLTPDQKASLAQTVKDPADMGVPLPNGWLDKVNFDVLPVVEQDPRTDVEHQPPPDHPITLPTSSSSSPVPSSSSPLTLWWQQDRLFREPRVVAKLQLLCPVVAQSAQTYALSTLYADAVRDHLRETAYEAGRAEFGYSVSVLATTSTVNVEVSGFSAGVLDWLRAVLAAFTRPHLDADRVEQARQLAVQDILNQDNQYVYQHGLRSLRLAMGLTPFSNQDTLAALRNTTFEKVSDFAPTLLARWRGQLYVYGDADPALAQALAGAVSAALPTQHTDSVTMKDVADMQPALTELPPRPVVLQQPAPIAANPNSATIRMYPLGLRTHCSAFPLDAPMTRAPARCHRHALLVDILIKLIQEPVFNVLRTQEQLGYIVGAYPFHAHTWATPAPGFIGPVTSPDDDNGDVVGPYILGPGDVAMSLLILVQGPAYDAAYMDNRVSAFLSNFTSTMASLSDDEWEQTVTAVIAAKDRRPLSLAEAATRQWADVAGRGFHFSRLADDVAMLRSEFLDPGRAPFAKNDLLELYVTAVVNGTSWLSVETFGGGGELSRPDSIPLDADVVSSWREVRGV